MNKIRKTVQFIITLLYNINLPNLLTGKISGGQLKSICVPGLNCYSCPAAVGSCPLGALQNTFSNTKHGLKSYVIGTILLTSLLFGRIVCGWLCPFGLLQELLYLIPVPKPKIKIKKLRFIKYFTLAILVIAIPILVSLTNGIGIPAFCKYVCPQGTIAGLLLVSARSALQEKVGLTFLLKTLLLISILIVSIIIIRPFCKTICPLGAIYGLFNKIALIRLSVKEDKCTDCGACAISCPMDLKPNTDYNSIDCIRCGKCVSKCPEKALSFSFCDIEKAKPAESKNN